MVEFEQPAPESADSTVVTDLKDLIRIDPTYEIRERGYVITYTIESAAHEPVVVRFVDSLAVPEAVDVGFNEDHRPDSWDLVDGHVHVEDVVHAHEASQLMLGIVAPDGDGEPIAESSDPELCSVEPVTEEDDHHDPDPSSTAPATESDKHEHEAATAGFDPSGHALAEGMIQWTSHPDDDGAPHESGEPGRPPELEASPGAMSDGVVDAFVAELESGDVSPDQLDILRDQLLTDVSRSEELRLGHALARIEELDVYVEMFETFVDEHGTLTEFAVELDQRLSEIEQGLDTIRAEMEGAATEREETAHRVDELRETVATLDENVQEFDATLETVSASANRFADLERALTDALAGDRDTRTPDSTPE